MKNFLDLLKEVTKATEDIYQVECVGNFYGGKFYETGLDSIFVLADSSEAALNLAKKNIDVITAMFKEKKYVGGKKALAAKDKSKIKIATGKPKKTSMKKFKKVLTKNDKFEEIDIKK